MLSAGRGRPARTPFGCLVRALPVVAWTECGVCCLSLVGPRICWPVGGTRDIPVEALFPQGRESFEVGFPPVGRRSWELMPLRDPEHGGHRGRVDHRQPFLIKGAGEERATERPVLTLDQLYALADLIPDRWKAFLLLKPFASLRSGRGHRAHRNDLDLERRTVRIRRQFLTMPRGLQLGPPKSRAGIRMISSPGRHPVRTTAPPGHLLS